MRVNVYVSIHIGSIKGGVAMTVAYCKKVHNFQMDSCKTCKKKIVEILVMSQRQLFKASNNM